MQPKRSNFSTIANVVGAPFDIKFWAFFFRMGNYSTPDYKITNSEKTLCCGFLTSLNMITSYLDWHVSLVVAMFDKKNLSLFLEF